MTPKVQSSSHAALPVDAAGWDARLRAADCSEAERTAFQAWLSERPENARCYEALQAMLTGLRAAHEVPEIQSMREAAVGAAGGRHRLVARGWRSWAMAAAVALAAFGFAYLNGIAPGDSIPARPAPAYSTAVGERSMTELEDGTVVALNTDTRLDVDMTGRERIVTLLRGQALFDVAKNPDRPFIVIAGERRITAVGTVFDVRYDGIEVKVTMVEGEVNVVAEESAGGYLTRPQPVASPVRLIAGQQLVAMAVATPEPPRIGTADLDTATLWREGRVFFDDATLSEAVAEMNRYSRTQIVVEDRSLDQYRVNGMFRTGQQGNFLDALEQYFPLVVEQDANGRMVLKAASN